MDQPACRQKPVEPRQNRALKTRAALLEAVEALVAAEDADAVTTTRIAAQTGVSVGTIYRYFSDREALLLAAYDATVMRIVEDCAAALDALHDDLPAADAARILLSRYLEAAEAIPAHAGLLAAMRSIRPIAADQQGNNQSGIMNDLFLPFLARYLPGAKNLDPVRLQLMSVLVGTMVDLYLVTAEPVARARLRQEIEAHLALMVDRISETPR